jgi:hypothetical protein
LLGSGASGDSTGFSDLDGLLVFSEVVERDPEALMHTARVVASSAKYLLARDALQHHGWFVATPSLLRAYPQSLLPLATLRDGVTALGPGRLHVRPITSRLIARRKLWSMVQVFRSLPNGGRSRTPRNLHEEKMLLSQFMLLPSLYLQAVDRYVPKRDSFALARQLLPSAPWEIMDRVSTVRLGWTQPKMGPAWQRLAEAIGPWEAQVAWRRLQSLRCDFYRPRRIPQSWVEEMRVFANCLLSSAEETNRGVKES